MPPNIRTTPAPSSYVMEAPRRGDGAVGGFSQIQLYIGLTLSWIAAAAPDWTTSTAENVPPAKSASVAQVFDSADAGSGTDTRNPPTKIDPTVRITHSRLPRDEPSWREGESWLRNGAESVARSSLQRPTGPHPGPRTSRFWNGVDMFAAGW